MNTKFEEWIPITIPFNTSISNAVLQQHHAAQLLALVGHYLIPQKPDDSNTNMEFIFDDYLLLGNTLPNGFRLSLNLKNLRVSIVNKEGSAIKDISLDSKTKEEVFDELKQSLFELGIEVSNLKNDLHYEISAHQLDKGDVFNAKDKDSFIENIKYRHNAKLVLNKIGELFESDEEIRIWPHHFDTGVFYVISENEKREATQTIGIGMSIPDGMVDEPYYYLSFWSESPLENIEKQSSLEVGDWKMPDWNGAVLKYSEIIKQDTAEEQHMLVKSFFTKGISIILNETKNN